MCASLAYGLTTFFYSRHGKVGALLLPVDGTKHMLFCPPNAVWKASRLGAVHTQILRSYKHLQVFQEECEHWEKSHQSVLVHKVPSHWFKVSSARLQLHCVSRVMHKCRSLILELNGLNFFGNVGCTQHLRGFSSQKLNIYIYKIKQKIPSPNHNKSSQNF